MADVISGLGNSPYLTQMRQMLAGSLVSGVSGQTGASKFQMLSKNRGLSMDEVFSKIDSDGDGLISKDEFEKAKAASEGRITGALAELQSSPTGSLLNLLSSQYGGSSSSQLFGQIDANGDGVITKDELTNAGSAAAQGGLNGLSSSLGVKGGAGVSTDPRAPGQAAARTQAIQAQALLQQAINQYNQRVESGQTTGAIVGRLSLTG